MTTTTEQTIITVERNPTVESVTIANESVNSLMVPQQEVASNEPINTASEIRAKSFVNDKKASKSAEAENITVENAQSKTLMQGDQFPSTSSKKKTLDLIPRRSAVLIVFIGIIAFIPLFQLIIGQRYADQCPINWRIPRYLFVSGVVGLTLIVLIIIEGLLSFYGKWRLEHHPFDICIFVTTVSAADVAIVIICLAVFLFGWFIAGCVWVFRAWDNVLYHTLAQSYYCYPTLYRFAFWLLLLSLLLQLCSCIYSCLLVPKKLGRKQKGVPSLVPTTEP
ncbi:unnamed protein product [Rotaria sp. Silwood1]|nr:unnamed protein product [Rotaria sp. Silwood1]CAF1623835.1 unnamed protein product [Rotaria sp. Silwood1]CAF3840295.1 unnamed protein product [Rotaria sp. Silwood1]CAF5082185.1 unnamed protein product [Rotaria sp. Silwood1]